MLGTRRARGISLIGRASRMAPLSQLPASPSRFVIRRSSVLRQGQVERMCDVLARLSRVERQLKATRRGML